MTLLTTLALLLVLLVRTTLRRFFGPVAAYQAWLIVPLVTVVTCLPTRAMPAIAVAPAVRSMGTLVARMAPATSLQVDILLVLWTVGALALAGWFIHAHRAFLRVAGPLRLQQGIYFSEDAAGPASVGWFAPKIIVPHDFTQHYSAAEQALVLAHERVHIARRDALANLLQAALQCVFWFNPVVHLAAMCFRQDQELSCDALVMAQHPHQRRSYAEALLKSHTSHSRQHTVFFTTFTTFTTFATSPIKERLMQLQTSSPRLSRRIAGRCVVAILSACALCAGLAARAEPAAPTYSVAMTIDADGAQSAPRVLVKGGEQFAVATGPWRIEMTVRAAKTAGDVWVAGKILKGDTVVGSPTLLVHVDQRAGVRVDDAGAPFALSMVVARMP